MSLRTCDPGGLIGGCPNRSHPRPRPGSGSRLRVVVDAGSASSEARPVAGRPGRRTGCPNQWVGRSRRPCGLGEPAARFAVVGRESSDPTCHAGRSVRAARERFGGGCRSAAGSRAPVPRWGRATSHYECVTNLPHPVYWIVERLPKASISCWVSQRMVKSQAQPRPRSFRWATFGRRAGRGPGGVPGWSGRSGLRGRAESLVVHRSRGACPAGPGGC